MIVAILNDRVITHADLVSECYPIAKEIAEQTRMSWTLAMRPASPALASPKRSTRTSARSMSRKQYLLFRIAPLQIPGEWRITDDEGGILNIEHFDSIAPQLVRLPCVKLPNGTVCAALEIER